MNELTLDHATFGPLGFGGSAVGNLYAPVSEEVAQAAIRTAVQLGIRYFDTAPHYGFGLSEKRLGEALEGLDPRQELVISTKVGRKLEPVSRTDRDLAMPRQGFVTPEPYQSEFDYSYEGTLRTYGSSLRRLRRRRIDILLAHDLGPFTHGENHPRFFAEFLDGGYRAMRELRDCGAVGAIGLGVNETQVVEEALEHADFDLVLLAGRYTLLEQGPLETFLPNCARRGVEVIIGGPYNSGILATGVRRGGPVNYNYGSAPEPVVTRVAQIESICDAHAVPLSAAAMQFPLAHPQVLTQTRGKPRPSGRGRIARTPKASSARSIGRALRLDVLSDNRYGCSILLCTHERAAGDPGDRKARKPYPGGSSRRDPDAETYWLSLAKGGQTDA